METKSQIRKHHAEQGVALLIAIFALLLVSVVAIALIVSSGTDSALAGNYRSSASAYYAALAGLEEARGRLLASNANCIQIPANGNCNQQPASVMPITQVVYIINPLGGEAVVPEDPSNPLTYPDTQYKQEFGVDVSTRALTKIASISPGAGLPGPGYKWVRINAVTEKSMGNGGPGVDVNSDGDVNAQTPLFYDPIGLTVNNTMVPGLVETTNPAPTAAQALEITALAVLPSGAQKMLQYVVRPLNVFPGKYAQTFLAPLTLAGNNVQFTGPGTNSFYIRGQDQCGRSTAPTPAIAYTTDSSNGDKSGADIIQGATPGANYPTIVPWLPPPSLAGSPDSIWYFRAYYNPNWLIPSGLDAVVQDITNNADVVIQGPATGSSLPSGMSAAHPMTIVVNGDLDFRNWSNTGYGLLVVTGTLYYDPGATWEGVILVVGQGNFVSTKNGTNGIDGAVFIAKTRDASGNLLPDNPGLGPSSFSQTANGANGGRGINYDSCLARSAQGPIAYKILAFKEIPLNN